MKFIAKPRSANSINSKEFNCAYEAIAYLNEVLAPKEEDEDYFFLVPKLPSLEALNSTDPKVAKRANKKLKEAIEDYTNIGKLIVA